MVPVTPINNDNNVESDIPLVTPLPVLPVNSQNPPIIATLQTANSDTLVVPQDATPSSKGPKIFLVLFLLFLMLSTTVLGLLYAIAYGKIKLNRPEVENPIAYFVQNLPFTPKTPKFLLTATLNAHKNIKKHSIDLSFVYESDQLMSVLGASRLDAQVKGAADYSDIKNPLINLSIDVTKDFNIELRKPNKMLYGKINKLPTFLLTFLGLSPSEKLDDVLSKWFYYDTTPLETEASKSLEQNNTTFTNKAVQEAIDKYLNEKAMSFFQVSKDKLDELPTYKITLISNNQFLDYIDEETKKNRPSTFDNKYKTSDYISDLKLDCWIDQKEYYLRKVSVSYKMNNQIGSLFGLSADPIIGNQSKSTVGMVLKMSDFNKPVVVDIPSEAITMEEYAKQFMEAFPAYLQQQERSMDARKKSDLRMIQSALDRNYITTNGVYASSLEELVTFGELKTVPTDPETKLPYLYKPTVDRSGYTLTTTLSDGSEYVLSYP